MPIHAQVMKGAIEAGIRRLFPLSLLVLQVGCLTAHALHHARPHDCKYGSVTEIKKAALSPTALFIEFRTESQDRTVVEDRVLRIPLNDSAWLHDPRGKPVHLSGAVPSDTQVHDIARWFLLPGDSIPAEAEALPIFRVETDDLGTLPGEARAVTENVQVFSVRYDMESTQAAWADPLIAILSRPDPKGWRTALIIGAVRERCEQEGQWYALVPLTVVGDAAHFPVYIVVDLLASLMGLGE